MVIICIKLTCLLCQQSLLVFCLWESAFRISPWYNAHSISDVGCFSAFDLSLAAHTFLNPITPNTWVPPNPSVMCPQVLLGDLPWNSSSAYDATHSPVNICIASSSNQLTAGRVFRARGSTRVLLLENSSSKSVQKKPSQSRTH